MNSTFSHFRRIVSSLLFMGLFSSMIFAQEPLRPGYIISLQGDTTFCRLALRGKPTNARMIRVHDHNGSEEKVYHPADIRGYGLLEGVHYESHQVSVNISSHKVAELSDSPHPVMKKDTLFLQVFVRGQLSLYFFKDTQDNLHFFTQKNHENPEPLIYHRYRDKSWEGDRVVTRLNEKKRYLFQLATLMGDNEEIRKEFLFQKHNQLKWKEAEIQAFVLRYNLLAGSDDLWFEKGLKAKSQPRVAVSLLVGAAFTKLKFVSGEEGVRRAHATADFPMTIEPIVGLSLHLQSKSNQGRWGFHAEGLYHRLQSHSSVEERIGESEYYKYDMDLDLSYVRLGTYLRFNKPTTSTFKPYALLGLTTSFLTKQTNSLTTISNFRGIHTIETEPIFKTGDVNKYEVGTAMGIGVTRGAFVIEAKYEFSIKGFSPIIGVGSPRQSAYILLGLSL